MSKKGKRETRLLASTIISLDDPKKVLYIKHADTLRWGFAGGVYDGEKGDRRLEDTAIRETYEEMGVNVKLINALGVYIYHSNHSHTVVNFIYRAKIISGIPTPNPKYGISQVRELSLGQAIWRNQRGLLCTGENNIIAFKDYLSGRIMKDEYLRSSL